MGRLTLGVVRDGSEDPREVQGRVGDPLGCPGRVWEPSCRFGTGWGTVVGPGRVAGPSGRSGTVWGNLGEVRDGSGDPPGGMGRVGGPSGKS